MTDDTDRARRVIRARREAAEKGVCPNAMCGEPLKPGEECPICAAARAMMDEPIPVARFVPYVEGTPGIRMTFPCLQVIGHTGDCSPAAEPNRSHMLGTCRNSLMIEDDETNRLHVDRLVEQVGAAPEVTNVSMGTLAPGQDAVIGESETIVFDQLIGPPMALRQKKEPKQ
jgi:hypothetical protein